MTSNEKLKKARKMIQYPQFYFLTAFPRIYAFTSENIAEYLDYFDLNGKSLLTVGSSSDQAINAIFKGTQDVSVIDVCCFTKEYFYLKKAAILSLSREEYVRFFQAQRIFPFQIETDAFEPTLFEKLEDALAEEDLESLRFWRTLLTEFPNKLVRKRLFVLDEFVYPENNVKVNPYLHSENTYLETRKKIKDVKPSFIESDLRDYKMSRDYDNIFLSNLFDYLTQIKGAKIVYQVLEHLTPDGKALLFYLYATTMNGQDVEREYLYDKTRIIDLFPDETEFYQFDGVHKLERYNELSKDGVLIYQNKRH